MGKINYIIGDFLWYGRNEILLDIFENHKEIIRENTCIHSFFGSFPNTIWNGGGVFTNYKNSTVREMKKVRNFYNKKGIAIVFTFTNTLIKEEHLHDEYCNTILKVFHNGKNEVLVANELLEQYIRKNYPKYKINRSIINTEDGSYVSEGYNITVLSKFKNKDFKFLKSLSIEDRNKTELLCNEFCINNCPYAYEHYREYAYIQLNGIPPKNAKEEYGKCRFTDRPISFMYNRLYKSEYRITYEDIVNTYTPMGFRYYKLSGRGEYNVTTIETILDYLIKPEYQMDVRVYLLERMKTDYKNGIRQQLKEDVNFRIYCNNKNYSYFD